MKNQEKVRQVMDVLINSSLKKVKCVIIVNNRTNTYECVETNDFFSEIIGEKGSIGELYDALLSRNKNGQENTGEYKQFSDLNVFKRDHYRVNIRFVVEGKEDGYLLFQSKISDDEMAVIITEQNHYANSDMIEMEKADTIQDSYLFSMIVNLADDSCINPNTTEVRSDRQDFMDIKYSDWRLMISNMFKEQDKVLFLRASSPENIINTLESKPRFNIDLQMMNMQGQYAWSRLCFARMKSFSRENPLFLYTVDDISEDMNRFLRQESITKAVEEQNEILQQAEKEKTLFFAKLSHEFRTPINAIMGMNEIIRCNSKESNIRECAEDIRNASEILLHLVNDVLDFSKIQAGKMEIIPVEYDTDELIKKVSNMIQLRLKSKPIEYSVKVSNDVPKRLFGDEIRIAQILTNLLTNAVKYTDEGKITLSVNATKDSKGMDAIEYIVEDTGCGIKEEDMEKLFSSYGRINIEKNRRVEGTGLGIGIVTGLLEAMNSQLHVESEYGKGSRFSFVLAQNYIEVISEDNEEKKEPKEDADISNKKILVVDDTPMNLKVADVLLKKLGGKADLADSGLAAVEMMKKQEYDIVFLDHLMPEFDGLDTLKMAREISHYYKKAPFIALTGNVSPTARDEYLCMGFTDYLEKPVNPEKMKKIINMYIK